jgi:hypothetical protein
MNRNATARGATLSLALLVCLVAASALATTLAPAASAATSVAVTMTFTEPLIADGHQGCTADDTNCGRGEVHPFGLATETILFGGGCGGTCDLRTINLPEGAIYLDETASDFTCPGACGGQSYPHGFTPFEAVLTDVVVGGTGLFAGATGNLSGTVVGAGWHGQIQIAGTLALAS